MPRSRSKSPAASRARSTSPARAKQTKPKASAAAASSTQDALLDAINRDDVDALMQVAAAKPELLSKVAKFGGPAKTTALAVAVSRGSWDVANEIAFTVLKSKGVEDVELDLRDAGRSLAPLLSDDARGDGQQTPRRLKKVIADAVARADDLDGKTDNGAEVTSQPASAGRQRAPRAAAAGSAARYTYHTGLFDVSVFSCLWAFCCTPCQLGEVYDELSGTAPTCFWLCAGAEAAAACTAVALAAVGATPGVVGLRTWAFCLFHCATRNKLNSMHGINEDPCTTCLNTWCCGPCSIVQMKKELVFREIKAAKE